MELHEMHQVRRHRDDSQDGPGKFGFKLADYVIPKKKKDAAAAATAGKFIATTHGPVARDAAPVTLTRMSSYRPPFWKHCW